MSHPSDYSGVTTADLAEIYFALNRAAPVTAQVRAVLDRVWGEIDRRDHEQAAAAISAVADRLPTRMSHHPTEGSTP